MLQREWNADPQKLPFAPYVKPHALITLVQKGLQYHELEQLVDQVRFLCPPSGTSLIRFAAEGKTGRR
jgi:hypothetical protein